MTKTILKIFSVNEHKEIVTKTTVFHENKVTCVLEENMKVDCVRKIASESFMVQY